MLWAVLVTYNRPRELRRHLEVLGRQTLLPSHVVIVDNGEPPVAASVVADHHLPFHATVVETMENLGPAGGIARGLELVVAIGEPDDWVVLLDDDDPPGSDSALEELLAIRDRYADVEPLGGVGSSGRRFNRHTGRLERLSSEDVVDGQVPVDVISGNKLPVYRVSALAASRGVNSDLFFGFEELDLGLALRTAGFALIAPAAGLSDGASMLSDDEAALERDRQRRKGRFTESRPAWRRYYSVRNLLLILRRYDNRLGMIAVTAREFGYVCMAFLKHIPLCDLKLSLLGVWHGWTGASGRTVEPVAKVRPETDEGVAQA